MSIYDLTWRQWCGVLALAILAAVIVGRAAWVLMGRHEQPREPTVLRRAAARIYQAIWPAEEYDEVTDDNGEPVSDLFEVVMPADPGRTAPGWQGPLENVPRPVIRSAEGVGLGPGHLHDGDLGGLDPEDAETVAQWRADHDAMAAEDSPGPDVTPAAAGSQGQTPHAGPGVIIQAAIVQGETVYLDGQPSPPRGWQPDDTVIDLRPEPRASHALWRQAAPSRADWYTQLMALRPAWYVTGGAA